MSLSLRQTGGKVAATAVVATVTLAGWMLFGSSSERSPSLPSTNRAWYTIDDGTTWFADSAERLTPFQKDGKLASRVYLHSFDGGKTIVATKLERYTKKANTALTAIRAAIAKSGEPVIEDREAEWNTPACIEIKRPGEATWKSAASEAAVKECVARDPKNPAATALPIYPPP